MIKVTDLFPKKELTEKEIKKREYEKKKKKIFKKFLKNPLKVNERMDEAILLIDDMVKDGVMTEEDKTKVLEQINKDMEKATKIMNKFRR